MRVYIKNFLVFLSEFCLHHIFQNFKTNNKTLFDKNMNFEFRKITKYVKQL